MKTMELERSLTEEELMEETQQSGSGEYEEDGSVWIYYKNQKMDIH